jgi:putative ABC transport system ATP-binding protein
MITILNLKKDFQTNEGPLTVLDIPELKLAPGLTYALIGPSGSGKSTLLSLLAGLVKPTTGEILVFEQAVSNLSENESAQFRLSNIGFVFQNFQLIDHLTALENICLSADLLGTKNAVSKGIELLNEVGLSSKAGNLPAQLSGGEQQRVAIARAFITTPRLILADEPTGNLDYANSEKIQNYLIELSKAHKTTVVVATHDLDFANRLDRKIELKAGKIVS